ncbi:DUF4873 domain-containing protein [Kibdelosporangium lantanae]|uniref:DUF4873 domain-containing protein n=1 Tax=Kibdelosporangium lantanae TaxID=1497396 RepID=A0ABW3MCA1_9PSEU
MRYEVAVLGDAPVLLRLKRAHYTYVLVDDAVSYTFDDRLNCWNVLRATGRKITARVVLLTSAPADLPTYLGVCASGYPNMFFVSSFTRIRYVMACLHMMGLADAVRMEVQPYARSSPPCKVLRRPNPHHFSLTPFNSDLDETHRGPAFVGSEGSEIAVEVHLTGHLQPIDGSYQWFGRITRNPSVTALHQAGRKDVTVRLPGRVAVPAQLSESDPWGNIRVTGTGRPPFPSGHR